MFKVIDVVLEFYCSSVSMVDFEQVNVTWEVLLMKIHDKVECDCNGIRTHNHLIGKQTLNRLAKLAK